MADPLREFEAELHARLGAAPAVIEPGHLTRFDDPEGRRGNGACWAVVYLDGRPAGSFGNWRTGERHTWTGGGKQLRDAQRQQLREATQQARQQRAWERAKAHRRAAAHASTLWQAASPADTGHPYIAAKRIPALGVRLLAGEVLLPLRDADGDLHNLQRIGPDGGKRFLRGGRVRGLFCLLARELPRGAGPLYLAEGWATAATIGEQLRVPVAAAMSAGNLGPVAEAIRSARPGLDLVIAADNDHHTPGNPGMAAARAAADTVGAALTWPTTCASSDCTCTDFNDLANCARSRP